ncbi:MAG: nucleotidyltransferase domain-containing protein [Acidobacteria bacterium]|nr:nucleotidyltransferase domain-containing protein [Acidobacteriota bacterium]
MLNLRSTLRQKLLGYYFTNPTANHYLRELAELLGQDPANLSRELAKLEREGLFFSEKRGLQRYFRLNRDYPLYEEVRRIIFKTVGVIGQLRSAFQHVPGIRDAYLYGSFARNQQDAASDVDLLIVGNVEAEILERSVRKLERQLRREINYTVLSPEELKARRAKKDAFLEDIWRHKPVRLLTHS